MAEAQQYNDPVEIGNGVYWVGARVKEFLRRNSYLRVFTGRDRTANLLVDPGPPGDWEAIARKVSAVIGDPANIQVVTVNHQDPDVGANAAAVAKLNPNVLVLMTEDTWRLAQYYGLSSRNFRAVERFKGMRIALPTGHVLQFVPTPFCHFRGACMVYDPDARVLFSGDLFGGIAATEFLATDAGWAGVKAFHQLYMPSNSALKLAISRIRSLDPPPLTIAPQHGGILTGEVMHRYLDRMEGLAVGLDILSPLGEKMQDLIAAVNEGLVAAREAMGAEVVQRITQVFHPDGSYPALFTLTQDDTVTDIKAEPMQAIESLVRLLIRQCPPDRLETFRARIIRIFLDRNLPLIESAMSGEEPVEAEILEEE